MLVFEKASLGVVRKLYFGELKKKKKNNNNITTTIIIIMMMMMMMSGRFLVCFVVRDQQTK